MRQGASPTDTGPAGKDHPELEDLAAYAEGRLSPSERARIAGHLAACPDCYELFTETVDALEDEEAGTGAAAAGGSLVRFPFEGRWLTNRRWIPAAAAAVLALGIGWVAYRELLAPPRMTIAGLAGPLAQVPGISRKVWTGEVTRGNEKANQPPLENQSFQLGTHEVDLAVSLDAGDSETAAEICRRIGNLLDGLLGLDPQIVSLFWQARTDLEAGKPPPGLREQLAEALGRAEPGVSPLYLQFGRWAEAARLSASTRRGDFFEQRANRRFLKLLLDDPARLEDPDLARSGVEIDPGVRQRLEEIQTIWNTGIRGRGELDNIRKALEAILKFYFSPPLQVPVE